MYTTCCVSDFAPFVKVDNVPNFYFIFYFSLKLQKMCFIIRLKRPFTIFQFQEDIWSHNSKNLFQIGPVQRWHELSAFGHNLFLKLNVAFQMYYNLRTFDYDFHFMKNQRPLVSVRCSPCQHCPGLCRHPVSIHPGTVFLSNGLHWPCVP